jgi:hypothetical protein
MLKHTHTHGVLLLLKKRRITGLYSILLLGAIGADYAALLDKVVVLFIRYY